MQIPEIIEKIVGSVSFSKTLFILGLTLLFAPTIFSDVFLNYSLEEIDRYKELALLEQKIAVLSQEQKNEIEESKRIESEILFEIKQLKEFVINKKEELRQYESDINYSESEKKDKAEEIIGQIKEYAGERGDQLDLIGNNLSDLKKNNEDNKKQLDKNSYDLISLEYEAKKTAMKISNAGIYLSIQIIIKLLGILCLIPEIKIFVRKKT